MTGQRIQGDWKTTTNKTKVFISLTDTEGHVLTLAQGKQRQMGQKRNNPREKQGNQYDSELKKSKPHVPLSLIQWVQITDLGGGCAEGSPSSGSGGQNSRLEVSSLRILRTITAASWFPASPGEVGPIGSSVGDFVGGFSLRRFLGSGLCLVC